MKAMMSRPGGAHSATPLFNAGRSRESPITHERLAELAYELYLARGGGDDHDLEDWLEAEKFLQQRDNRHSSGVEEELSGSGFLEL